MIKLTASEKRTLVLGISFLAVFSLVYWIILPGWDQYQEINTKLTAYKNSYQQTEMMARMEGDYISRVAGYAAAYTELKARYYANINEKEAKLKFLALVEELTEKSGVSIISKTTGVNVENGYKSIKVNLTLKGTSEELTDLLLAYTGSETTIRVDRIRVDLDQRNRLLQLKLTVSTLIIEEEGGSK